MMRYIIGLLCLFLVSCGNSADYTGSYIASDQTGVLLLEIVESEGGALSGTLTLARPDRSSGAIQSLSTRVSGIREADVLSLDVHRITLEQQVTGMVLRVRGDTLVWQAAGLGRELEFRLADHDEYQEQVAALYAQSGGTDTYMLDDQGNAMAHTGY